MEQNSYFSKHKWSFVALSVALVLLVTCSILLSQKGIFYKEYFLRGVEENCWKGDVLGETVTITRTPGVEGTVVSVACQSGNREFLVIGERKVEGVSPATLYEGDTIVFEGLSHGAVLQDREGTYILPSFSATKGEDTYFRDGNGNYVPDSPLLVDYVTIIELGFGPQEKTRGDLFPIVMAVLILALFCVELWCPELFFYLGVGRFAVGEVEPSDAYWTRRTLGLIVTGGVFLFLLFVGFVI